MDNCVTTIEYINLPNASIRNEEQKVYIDCLLPVQINLEVVGIYTFVNVLINVARILS